METHVEDATYGDSYTGYIVWRLIKRVQCMGTNEEVAIYGNSYGG